MGSINRALIVKVSALGDIIHALPVSAALKDAYPHIELMWAVEEQFVPLLSGNPCLSGLVVLPKVRGRDLRIPAFYRAYFDKIREAVAPGIDLSIDLQGLTKSAVIALKSGAKTRIGYHWLREGARLLEKPVPKRPDSVHIVDQYLDVAWALGAKVDSASIRFPFHIPEQDADAVCKMLKAEPALRSGDKPFVSINPASARPLKEWGAEKFAGLIDALSPDVPCVLVTADMKVAEKVEAAAARPFVNLAGRTNLKQLAAVLSMSAVHICSDTGSGHLAAALGRQVISLIGPTDPERACPYGQRENVIENKSACSSKCTGRHCKYSIARCMDTIEVRSVYERVMNLLNHNQ